MTTEPYLMLKFKSTLRKTKMKLAKVNKWWVDWKHDTLGAIKIDTHH